MLIFALKQEAHKEQIMALRAQYAKLGSHADAIFESRASILIPSLLRLKQWFRRLCLIQAARGLGLSVGAEFASRKLSNPLFVQQSLYDLIPYNVLDRSGNINVLQLKATFEQDWYVLARI